MPSGTLAESIDELKRKRLEVRAAIAASRAEGKRLKLQEDAVARQWVLPEDGGWCTLVNQFAGRGGSLDLSTAGTTVPVAARPGNPHGAFW